MSGAHGWVPLGLCLGWHFSSSGSLRSQEMTALLTGPKALGVTPMLAVRGSQAVLSVEQERWAGGHLWTRTPNRVGVVPPPCLSSDAAWGRHSEIDLPIDAYWRPYTHQQSLGPNGKAASITAWTFYRALLRSPLKNSSLMSKPVNESE